MNKNLLTEEEEKSLIGILYNNLSLGTSLEVLGELHPPGIKRMDLQRRVLGKLLRKFNLEKNLTNENYLFLGMADSCSKEYLAKCRDNETNKHLQNRAKYFLRKIYGE